MPPNHAPKAKASPLRAENEALRAQVQQLQADRTTVAKKKAKDDKYAQSQVRFRTVFENSPLGQKIINPDLVIRQANPALVAMLGLTRPDEVEGRRILEFAHPHYRADWNHLQERLWQHRIPNSPSTPAWCWPTVLPSGARSTPLCSRTNAKSWAIPPSSTPPRTRSWKRPSSASTTRRKPFCTWWPTT